MDWTVSHQYPLAGPPAAPAGYLEPNESVIVSDIAYDYRPGFGLFLADGFRFIRHAYVRPRLSAKVELR